MTATTSVHSNAFNFMSFLSNGVDPRTGQYTVSISLPEVQANGLIGPGLPLALVYSPLNTQDSGYGKGWSLQLSQFDPASQVISLSSGESLKVTGTGTGDRLTLQEQKIDNFHLHGLGSEGWRLVHKSGLVEWLQLQGSGVGRVALPVKVQAASGHAVTLEYRTFDNAWPLLVSVKDQAGNELLSIDRVAGEVEILLNPGAGPEGEALAAFIMNLTGSDNRVASISLPTENRASWRFAYSEQRGLLCISTVHTPTGAREEVLYQDGGHEFPAGSGRAPLPRVTRHSTYPGFGQDNVEVAYSYDPNGHNFLGAGLSIAWRDDGLDNLYKHIGSYRYQTTETLWVDGQARRSIERSFNQFHLLVNEVTTQGSAIKSVETLYPYADGVPFKDQPAQCQLPESVTTRWRRSDTPNLARSETVLTAYDRFGNLTREQQASGVVETSTWYANADAGADYPADPEGFVRWRKDLTVTPAATTQAAADAAQELRTVYRYQSLPALTGSQLPGWHVTASETLVQVSAGTPELQRTDYIYIDQPADAQQHGRVQRQTLTMNNQATVTDYRYSLLDSPELKQSVLHTEQTLTGFDGEQKTISLESSLFTGEPLLERDDNDVEIRYSYDALRRVTKEIVAPGTQWEAARQYRYVLCANEGEQAEQTRIDVKQVHTISRFDGLNRVVAEVRDDADSPGWAKLSRRRKTARQRRIYQATYDSLGQLATEIEYDWLDSDELALTSGYEYDDWGEQRSVIGPDGVRTVEETDPVGTAESNGPIRRSWREGTGLRSGVTETWLNLFDEPTRMLRQDQQGVAVSLTEYQYDGLGRRVEQRTVVDGSARRDRSSYDAFDRLTENTLADDAIVHRQYAEHSSEDLPVRISVEANGTDTLLGEQVFDGLDRRTEVITGGRKQLFSYAPGQYQPQEMTTSSGQPVKYEYLPQLGTEPLLRRLPGSIDANYTYDEKNALLLACDEQGEALQREYFSTQQLKSETRRSGEETWVMHYRYSRLGRLLGYTDVLGQQQTCDYDPQGRLRETRLGSTVAQLQYDGLSRLAHTLTRDDSSSQHLGISLEYDDFDREIRRLFDLNGTEQTLEQHWNEDDEVGQRLLKEGASVLRDETYEYDRRGRLVNYSCSGSQAPVDPYGKTIDQQIFVFDALDNITTVRTFFAEGSNRASYRYTGQDPAQLSRIENNHADYPASIDFSYDDDGNLLSDERARTLTYDALNRLTSVSGASGSYRYDPLDTLAGGQGEQRFYQSGQLSTRLADGQRQSWLRGGDTLLAEAGQVLLATDASNTVLGELDNSGTHANRYTAYGHKFPQAEGGPAFNGEYAEPATAWQLLGNGYRAFNPVLMRFHSPDNLSPFDEGGVNAYVYCEGDPVNGVDPSGHGFFTRIWRFVRGKNRPSTRTTESAGRYGTVGDGGFTQSEPDISQQAKSYKASAKLYEQEAKMVAREAKGIGKGKSRSASALNDPEQEQRRSDMRGYLNIQEQQKLKKAENLRANAKEAKASGKTKGGLTQAELLQREMGIGTQNRVAYVRSVTDPGNIRAARTGVDRLVSNPHRRERN